jgi:hypothetical protein
MVQIHADEASVSYQIWPEGVEEGERKEATWPPPMYDGFRPDVPLAMHERRNMFGVTEKGVRRSNLKPCQAREAVSGQVWLLRIDNGCVLVLGLSLSIPDAYERLGFVGGNSWYPMALLSTITIV